MISNLSVNISLYSLPQVRVVLLAAAPADQLFVLSGGADEMDRQLLDDLGLSGVKEPFPLIAERCKQKKDLSPVRGWGG